MSWPADVDTVDELLLALNNWWTTLPSGIDASMTTFSISNGDSLQDTKGVLSIEDEVIYYATITRTPFNATLGGVIRGYDGTIARPHVEGTRVELRWVAAHHNTLVERIRTLETFLGALIHQDDLNGVSFDTLAARLTGTLPLVRPGSGATWVFNHTRDRILNVQLWLETSPGVFAKTDAPVVQVVNPGGASTVTVDFGVATNGYAVLT